MQSAKPAASPALPWKRKRWRLLHSRRGRGPPWHAREREGLSTAQARGFPAPPPALGWPVHAAGSTRGGDSAHVSLTKLSSLLEFLAALVFFSWGKNPVPFSSAQKGPPLSLVVLWRSARGGVGSPTNSPVEVQVQNNIIFLPHGKDVAPGSSRPAGCGESSGAVQGSPRWRCRSGTLSEPRRNFIRPGFSLLP